MMRTIVLALSLSASAALVCEDLSSCEGCVAKRFDKNKFSCKPWGPKTCTNKDNTPRWDTVYCVDPCEEFPECDCVGEKANGARKCLTQTRDEAQCDAKDARDKWTTSWCASTDPPTAQPTTLEPTAGPTATDPPTAQPTTRAPTVTASPTAVTNPPTAEIVDCFQNSGDCGECCPACTAAVVGEDSFTSIFSLRSSAGNYWEPKPGVDRCVCLDVDKSGYNFYEDGDIYLTSFSDCVRIMGDRNYVYGEEGDDAMIMNGGDVETARASGNRIIGGSGEGDVCTPFGFECEDRRKLTDAPKLAHTAAGTKAARA